MSGLRRAKPGYCSAAPACFFDTLLMSISPSDSSLCLHYTSKYDACPEFLREKMHPKANVAQQRTCGKAKKSRRQAVNLAAAKDVIWV